MHSTVQLLKTAFQLFRQNDPLRMAASTSFFVSFALPAILYILIVVLGSLAGPRAVGHDLFQQLGVGLDTNIASQVRDVVRNIHRLPLNWGLRIGGFLFLLFVATTLFEIVKNSINQLWKIRPKAQQGIAIGRPNARIAWAGAFFTALLYTGGQLLLHRVLDYENMQVIYGASTALALLLLFVFYCCFIFYFGACFTWALGQHYHLPIQPSRHAETTG
jgi:membrane protein